MISTSNIKLFFCTAYCSNDSQPFPSRANSIPGVNRPIGPWPIFSLELSLPRVKWPGALSFPGTFALKSIRSQERSLPETCSSLLVRDII